MATPVRVVTLTVDELDRRMEQAAYKAVAKFVKEQEENQTHAEPTIPMPEIVNSRRYGSRNTVAKYRDEIMTEDDNQSIVVKRGSRYYFDPVKFDDWFMKRKKINEEKLKVDPRRR